MTAVTPTVQLLLDDGTGTYPTDITSRLSLKSITISGHGRTDEFSTASATTFSCTLKNNDGGLSAGSITPGQGIRYKETKGATTVNAFTGKVSELPLGWDGGPAKSAHVTLTAVDPLAELARRELRSMLEEEVLLLDPTAYYTLGEVEGSTTAGDSSGGQAPPLVSTDTGTAFTMGTGTGPVDGLSATQFFGGTSLLGLGGTYASAAASFTLEAFVNSTFTGIEQTVIQLTEGAVLGGGNDRLTIVIASGTGAATIRIAHAGTPGTPATGPSITDGLTHHVAATYDGAGNIELFVDGVSVAAVASGVTLTDALSTLFVGPNVTGTLSHIAVYDVVLTPTQIATHAAVGMSTLRESTAARFARIAAYVGGTTSTPSNSGVLMATQATSGSSALDVLQAVANAEGGIMFANGTGTLVLQGHAYRALKVTPTLTVPLKDLTASSVTMPWDTQQLVNKVSATRTGGASVTVKDQPSIDARGTFPQSLDLALAADSDVLSAAQWVVNKHSTPTQRMPSVTVNLLTSSTADTILATEIGDRWALSGLPSQTWSGFGDQTVEGWSRTLSVTESGAEWSMTVSLLPYSLSQMWILGNATYGLLGTTTILG